MQQSSGVNLTQWGVKFGKDRFLEADITGIHSIINNSIVAATRYFTIHTGDIILTPLKNSGYLQINDEVVISSSIPAVEEFNYGENIPRLATFKIK